MTTSVPLLKIIGLFVAILIAGTLTTLPLFKFNLKKFVASSLFIKIITWIPIFLIFVLSLYIGNLGRLIIVTVLLLQGLRELLRVIKIQKNPRVFIIYYLFFALALLHFYILGVSFRGNIVSILITLCFGSVLSDVCAFFFGNYLGRHKLPKSLNNRKSWEGVLGQILGALVGVLLVRQFVVRFNSIWIFLPIGLGSAVGDLYNSFVKRHAGIKDWGNSIPGHGGYLDRLSSLSWAILVTYYFLKL